VSTIVPYHSHLSYQTQYLQQFSLPPMSPPPYHSAHNKFSAAYIFSPPPPLSLCAPITSGTPALSPRPAVSSTRPHYTMPLFPPPHARTSHRSLPSAKAEHALSPLSVPSPLLAMHHRAACQPCHQKPTGPAPRLKLHRHLSSLAARPRTSPRTRVATCHTLPPRPHCRELLSTTRSHPAEKVAALPLRFACTPLKILSHSACMPPRALL